ncbi:uncharacterized protein LOC132613382 [Lycium barbarum]|uniref:uncharacterized protein LOC132613382 n=1 Tax=Lycium barbarum TaxID=112863 RepID=UPI00293EA14A|nr:uncharacterized protein LOC132613382 [Lycium barbarum]
MAFFLWIVWHRKLPVDDVLAFMGINLASICRCCMVPQQETMIHMFLTGEFAVDIWQVFATAVGVNGPFVQINQAITKWWTAKCNSKLRPLYQAAPSIIMYHLWKRRNTIVHGGRISRNQVLYGINQHLVQLAKQLYPGLTLPDNWPQLVHVLEVHQPYITCTTVQWLVRPTGWFKCNTDGAYKSSTGQSSSAFCIRDSAGDLMFAWASTKAETSSLEAEAKAILEGDLAAEAKLIVLSDKMQMPSFRFKTWKTREPD